MTLSVCTWKGCQANGTSRQDDNDGNQWAMLCPEHAEELEKSLDDMNPKAMLRAWVLASGGAKEMVQ